MPGRSLRSIQLGKNIDCDHENVRRIRPKQGGQCLLDVAGRHTAQAEYRQQRLETRRAAAQRGRIAEVNRTRSSASPVARARISARWTGTAPIPVWMLRSGPWPCRTKTGAAVLKLPISHQRPKGLGFRLDRLYQQALRA